MRAVYAVDQRLSDYHEISQLIDKLDINLDGSPSYLITPPGDTPT